MSEYSMHMYTVSYSKSSGTRYIKSGVIGVVANSIKRAAELAKNNLGDGAKIWDVSHKGIVHIIDD